MTIGIDASQAIHAQKTGVQWYVFHLLRALTHIIPPEYRVRLYSPQPLTADFTPLPSHWEERILHWPLHHGWTLFRLANELRRNPPDVFFAPGHIIPPRIPCKTVVTIHDLGFREFSKAYAHPRLMNFLHKRDAQLAHAVITPSEATKNAIINAYSINQDKIHVIPHGYDAETYHPYSETETQPILNKYGIKKPYVISVGRLEGKKNTLGVLKLIQSNCQDRHPDRSGGIPRQARDEAKRLSLVLIGTPGYGYNKIKQWITDNKAGEWVHELGWLPSADTAKLMSGASALITLSRAEGFGLTVLEALACNTPILASDIPAHREIGKDLITYADPNNLTDSTNKLINIINPTNHDASHALSQVRPVVNAVRSATGVEGSLSNYAWSRSAQQALAILTNP